MGRDRDPYAMVNYDDRRSSRSTSSESRHSDNHRSHYSNNSRRSQYSSQQSRSSTAASSVIDPSKPQWWNDKKKAQRAAAASKKQPGVQIMSEESIRRQREKSGIDYGVGAFAIEGEDSSSYRAKLEKKFKGGGSVASRIHDDRIRKDITAEEELGDRKLTDLIDRSTLMVGVCLILIVIIAVTIPVVLISEEEPYVALAPPDPPTTSPTMVRQTDYWPIYDRLVNIAGGDEVLSDPTTAQNRAFNWLVYEDGMELGASKDHLHQRFVLMVIYFISGPWTPVEGTLEWGSP
eukprot:scaffold190286_cov50-Cyclotella_meneghiniana.AAC.1